MLAKAAIPSYEDAMTLREKSTPSVVMAGLVPAIHAERPVYTLGSSREGHAELLGGRFWKVTLNSDLFGPLTKYVSPSTSAQSRVLFRWCCPQSASARKLVGVKNSLKSFRLSSNLKNRFWAARRFATHMAFSTSFIFVRASKAASSLSKEYGSRSCRTPLHSSAGEPGHDGVEFIPAPHTSLKLIPPRPLKGASRGVAEVGQGAAPAGRSRKVCTRAASGLRPGPLRGPARSWLTTCSLALSAFGLLEREARAPGPNRRGQAD